MKEKYLKNSIISAILIVSTILMPLSFIPRKTEAANIGSYLGGLSQVITQMPLCQSIGSIKELFSQGKNLEAQALQDLAPTTPKEAPADDNGTLTDKVDSATNSNSAVQTTNPTEEKSTAASAKANKDINASTAKLSNNDTCLKSIGRAVIKMLLQKITTDTVSWINGGMDGEPKFVQNPGEYFKDIAKTEILGFAGEINDQTKFPFGKAFLQSEAASFNNKFADNAQYSLNKMIQDTSPGSMFTDQTFSHDFSQGGWGAWDAMTQNPANNPLGFALMASNELAKRIEDKTNLAKESLQQSGGYLGVQKCVDPAGVTKQEDDRGQKERAASKTGPYQDRICKDGKWNFVTPGQMVAAAATKAVGYPESNLLKAEDLNDAVAAILDALLSHYSSSFMSEGGFAGLSDTSEFQQGSEGQFVINQDNINDYGSPQTRQDFTDFQVGASSFLAENPNFNIRTDINQALIDEQRIFRNKLIEQNKELKSTVPLIPATADHPENALFTGNYGIIPTIYQLDYCIPGPHPGWEQDSREALSAALNTVTPETDQTIKDRSSEDINGLVQTLGPLAAAASGAIVGAAVGSVVPVIGNAVGLVVGALVGWLVSLIGTGKEKKIRQYYAGAFLTVVGVVTAVDKNDSNAAMQNWGPFADSANRILDRYINMIHEVYNSYFMPSVTNEAAGKFLELKGYNQMYTNNEARIISMKSVVERLTEIKNKIDTLNQNLKDKNVTDIDGVVAPADDVVDADGNITKMGQQSQYEENLKPWISAFGRISQEMVTGDDIAAVDNTIKQIIDEKDYIYNDLLKGPNGCEKDLELGKPNAFPWQIYDLKRVEYPGPILYDYNNYQWSNQTPNAPTNRTWYLPDPYNSGYKNKMKQDVVLNNIGPGFLSMKVFQSTTNWSHCADDGTPIIGQDLQAFFNSTCSFRLTDIGASGTPPDNYSGGIPLRDFNLHLGVLISPPNPGWDNKDIGNGTFESSIGVW